MEGELQCIHLSKPQELFYTPRGPSPLVNAVLACDAPVTLRRLGNLLRYDAQHLRGDNATDVGNQYIQSSRM